MLSSIEKLVKSTVNFSSLVPFVVSVWAAPAPSREMTIFFLPVPSHWMLSVFSLPSSLTFWLE